MRITLLCNSLRVGGGLTVGRNMIAAFGRVAPEHEYFCVAHPHMGYEAAVAGLPRARTLFYEHRNDLARLYFEQIALPREVRAFRPDAVFAINGRPMIAPGCPQAAFPQDSRLFYPARHLGPATFVDRLKIRYHRSVFARRLAHAHLLLVQTPVVERRIRERFAYRGRVIIGSTAISPFLAEGGAGRAVPEPYRRAGGRFKLLYLARYYPHKNLEGVLRLAREHAARLRETVIFTTVGADQHPGARRFLSALERLGSDACVINLGPIPHEEVAAYYEHCDAFFMPTLLETFGIPYLEAMAFQRPILTSDLDFARAVCGDAAEYFDPWNVDSMCAAIERLRTDADLRQRLRDAGRARRTQAFPTWDELARRVLGELTEVIGAGQRSSGELISPARR